MLIFEEDKQNVQSLMQQIYDLKKSKEDKEKIIKDNTDEVKKLDDNIDTLSKNLLLIFNTANEKIYKWEEKDLVAQKFSRENIGYTSENDVLTYLKNNYNAQYIKTKITESLDKNALKKAIKTDTQLSTALEAMTVKSTSEFIVVTDSKNYQLMLEHINANGN